MNDIQSTYFAGHLIYVDICQSILNVSLFLMYKHHDIFNYPV